MPSLQELTERLSRVDPGDYVPNRPVLIDLGETGLIHVADGVVSHDDKPADCRISLSAGTLAALMDGTLDPTMAYLTGKLSITGDMTLARQLSGTLRRA